MHDLILSMADKIKHLEDRVTQSDTEMGMLWQRLEDCQCATPAEISPEKWKEFTLKNTLTRVVKILCLGSGSNLKSYFGLKNIW